MRIEFATALVASCSSLSGALIGAGATLLANSLQERRRQKALRVEKLRDAIRAAVGDLIGSAMVYVTRHGDMIEDTAREMRRRETSLRNRSDAMAALDAEVSRRLRGDVSNAMIKFQSRLAQLHLLIAGGGSPERALLEQAGRLVEVQGDDLVKCRGEVIRLTFLTMKKVEQPSRIDLV